MPQFRYTARNASGQMVDGIVTANDRSGAISEVEQQRFVPVKIQLVSDESSKSVALATKPAAKEKSPAKSDSNKAAA
ncbi:MAG: hypothetical protein WCK17_04470, partial [Verrucomicrobiota bacterium]